MSEAPEFLCHLARRSDQMLFEKVDGGYLSRRRGQLRAEV